MYTVYFQTNQHMCSLVRAVSFPLKELDVSYTCPAQAGHVKDNLIYPNKKQQKLACMINIFFSNFYC